MAIPTSVGPYIVGQSVGLSCVAGASNPVATLSWYRDNVFLSSNEYHTITAQAADNGINYHCEVTNLVGTVTSSIVLVVEPGSK